jgi:hypothetical protein
MRHKLFNTEQEYFRWARTVKIDVVGGEDEVDWDLRDELKRDKPLKYPVVLTYFYENSFDRTGDLKTRLNDFIYLSSQRDSTPMQKKMHTKPRRRVKNLIT